MVDSDLYFPDSDNINKSQLRQARYSLLKLVPLKRNFSWEMACDWKELKSDPNFQNEIILSEKDIDEIVEKYKEWVKTNTCYAIQDEETKEIQLFRTAKRGNSVYRRLLNKKLDSILSFMDSDFQNKVIKDVAGFRKKKTAQVLFISLTCNPEKVNNNLLMAWFNIENYYNLFITSFRQKYGEAFAIKTIEAQENGYPHIHLFLICKNSFKSFEHKSWNKYRNKYDYSWRVEEKRDIEKFWKLGFSDVKVPINVSDQTYSEFIKDYMFKDMFKSFRPGHKNKRDYRSLALSWLFGKQCFSISCTDLIKNISITQIQIEEIKQKLQDKRYKFLGFIEISCRTSKPPPESLTIKPEDSEYYDVLRHIRKPFAIRMQESPRTPSQAYHNTLN